MFINVHRGFYIRRLITKFTRGRILKPRLASRECNTGCSWMQGAEALSIVSCLQKGWSFACSQRGNSDDSLVDKISPFDVSY